jgi:hypothetical protein
MNEDISGRRAFIEERSRRGCYRMWAPVVLAERISTPRKMNRSLRGEKGETPLVNGDVIEVDRAFLGRYLISLQ